MIALPDQTEYKALITEKLKKCTGQGGLCFADRVMILVCLVACVPMLLFLTSKNNLFCVSFFSTSFFPLTAHFDHWPVDFETVSLL